MSNKPITLEYFFKHKEGDEWIIWTARKKIAGAYIHHF